jgi:ferritin-like metal-binding protein YciE
MSAASTRAKAHDLEDLFVHGLKDILWVETQLIKSLPKMARAARSGLLRTAITRHLGETVDHLDRLHTVFEGLSLPVRAVKCEAMAGLLKEGAELMEHYSDSTALDAALITAAQKIEHYEIAAYGTLRAFAQHLGHIEAGQLLAQTLKEEAAADQTLTHIAERDANESATAA